MTHPYQHFARSDYGITSIFISGGLLREGITFSIIKSLTNNLKVFIEGYCIRSTGIITRRVFVTGEQVIFELWG